MRWTCVNTPESQKTDQLQKAIGVDRPIAELLAKRNITTFDEAKMFFRPNLDELHDPFLMKGMQEACQHIISHLEQDKPIMVFGDTINGTGNGIANGLNLTSQEKKDLVTFLKALSDETFINNPEFSDPNN